jgi:hypothetical protein
MSLEADKNDLAFFKNLDSPDNNLFLNTSKNLILQKSWDKKVRGKGTIQ